MKRKNVKIVKGMYMGKGDYLYDILFKGNPIGTIRKRSGWMPQRTKVTFWRANPKSGFSSEFDLKDEAIEYLLEKADLT